MNVQLGKRVQLNSVQIVPFPFGIRSPSTQVCALRSIDPLQPTNLTLVLRSKCPLTVANRGETALCQGAPLLTHLRAVSTFHCQCNWAQAQLWPHAKCELGINLPVWGAIIPNT